jgi:tight adherence protein B
LAGVLTAGGLVGAVAGFRRSWAARAHRSTRTVTWERLTRRPPGRSGRRRDALLVASLVAGVLTAGLTGWVVAIAIVPVLVVGLPYLLVLPKQRDVAVREALDRWVRALAATMATGRSVPDAIRVSRRTAPPALRDELDLMVTRLNTRWETAAALRGFADGLSSPDVDAVVAALILTSNRGSHGASETLHALAESLQDQLRARRLIEAERAKPYVVVRQVTVITMAVLALVLATNPDFFAPYRTPLGQLVVSVLAFLYLGSLVLMRRKAKARPRERILIGVRA